MMAWNPLALLQVQVNWRLFSSLAFMRHPPKKKSETGLMVELLLRPIN
jgi:hypothetical protein